ncbi:hypothetical protein [Streptomyces sp. NPDC006285]|uniref:hypothetical protein n=1 Tax=Streptomyces sp. NPDC006285 TaxID=3364742 RepID=UPI0036AF6F51
MIRTARVRPVAAASGVFPATAVRGAHGPRGASRLAVPVPESACPPGSDEDFRRAAGPAAPGLDYALSFVPEVTEAVEGASAGPGALLPGTR